MATKIQDGGYAWAVCLASFLSQVVHGGLVFSMGMFFIMFRNGLDAGDGALTFITSLNYSICFAVCPLVGMLTARFGERKLAMFGSWLATIGLACSALSTQIYHLYILYGLIAGVGMGLAYNPSVSILAKHFNSHKKIATGLAVCGVGAGSFIFPPIIKALEDTYGWRGALIMVAGIQAQSIILSVFFRTPEEAKPGHKQGLVQLVLKDGEAVHLGSVDSGKLGINDMNGIKSCSGPGNGGECRRGKGEQLLKQCSNTTNTFQSPSTIGSRFVQWKGQHSELDSVIITGKADLALNDLNDLDYEKNSSLFKNVPFISLCLHSMTIQFPIAIVYTHLGNYALYLGFVSRDVVLLYMVMGIVMTTTRALMGIIAELTRAKPSILVIPCAVINGVMTILLPFTNRLCIMYVYAVLMPMLLAPYTILIMNMESVPVSQVPTAYGIVCFARVPAIAFGAPIAAWVYEITQIYASSFYLAGALFLIAGMVMVPQATGEVTCGGCGNYPRLSQYNSPTDQQEQTE